ncbi:hypothetical protein ACI6QG_18855 [Roseococcus sp. DSY-14]|uniref:hypothetical protein n=1 Tax=Roseococcus sp. DSY-14 TaxID=3369650 RepID=UPI00387AC321
MSGAANPLQPGMPHGNTPLRARGQGGMLLIPWQSGMDSGSGYDTVTRTVLPSAAADRRSLRGFVVRDEAKGMYVQKRVQQVETIQKLREVLQFGTELDVGYDAFSANSIGKFMKETRVDSYNLYFLVTCFVQSTEVRIDGFKLHPDFQATRYDDDRFRTGFGDYFVSGWVTGGYLIGLAEVRARSEQAFADIRAEIGGKYSDGILSAKGRFSSNWEKWEARSDVHCEINVIYAGMGGTPATVVPIPAGVPSAPEPRPSGSTPGGTSSAPRNPILAANRIPIRYEDDDDGEDEDEFVVAAEDAEPRRPAGGGPPAPRGGGTAPIYDQPFDHIPSGLQPVEPVSQEAVKLTMQGLLDAADNLVRQAPQQGVPLYAILEPYSPRYRQSGELDIEREEYTRKRDLLNQVYLKARMISNAVGYAQGQATIFPIPPSQLKALQARMTALMEACETSWHSLKLDPNFTLPPGIQIPADDEIPAWAVEKAAFSPFPKPLNPVLFTRLFEEAIEAAKAQPDKAARKALRGYLELVMETCEGNYVRAKDAMTAIALTFGALDEEVSERTGALEELAGEIGGSRERWTMDSAELEAAFQALDGVGGLDDDKLDFLSRLNPILFKADKDVEKQPLGFAAFWAALHPALTELAARSRQWEAATAFRSVVNAGTERSWTERAALFQAQIVTMGTRVRAKLDAV